MSTTIALTLDGPVNEYGTPISVHQCATCGHWFTVTGRRDQRHPDWQNCLTPDCESYDVERDADLMFEIEPWRIHRDDGAPA